MNDKGFDVEEAPEVEAAAAAPKASKKKAAPAEPDAEELPPAKASKPVRGRRSNLHIDAPEDGFEYLNSFARRAPPSKVGSEAWHLWAVTVRVFVESIAPKISDRTRSKKEAGVS